MQEYELCSVYKSQHDKNINFSRFSRKDNSNITVKFKTLYNHPNENKIYVSRDYMNGS